MEEVDIAAFWNSIEPISEEISDEQVNNNPADQERIEDIRKLRKLDEDFLRSVRVVGNSSALKNTLIDLQEQLEKVNINPKKCKEYLNKLKGSMEKVGKLREKLRKEKNQKTKDTAERVIHTLTGYIYKYKQNYERM